MVQTKYWLELSLVSYNVKGKMFLGVTERLPFLSIPGEFLIVNLKV